MEIYDKIDSIKEKQKSILQEIENLGSRIKEFDNIKENETLKKEISGIKKEFDEISKIHQKTLDELQNTRLALQEQIIDEKMNLIKISKDKLQTYFEKEVNSNLTVLETIELNIRNKIHGLITECKKNLTSDKKKFIKEIENLSLDIDKKIQQEREKIRLDEKNLKDLIESDFQKLKSGKIDKKLIEKRIKQNKIEMKIGLNVLNKVGIILILIGLGFFVYYNRNNINAYLKSIAVFAVGIISLIIGEFLYRRKKDVFSKGLIGAGIAILYTGLFYSYFLLKIIDMYPALLLSVLVSILSIILSLRYNSRTIISFALIGGYLPFLSFVISEHGLKGNEFYIGMAYLFILNIIVLLISFFKDWQVPNFLSFGLNIPCLIYLVFNCPKTEIGIIYSGLTFFVYLFLVIMYPLKSKKEIKIPGLILLGLSTTINAVIIYLLFAKLNLFNDYKGLLALIFCLVYIGLSFVVKRFIPAEKNSFVLFYITSLTFAVLIIPFQFGITWITIGWLIEGMLLTIFGYKKNIKLAEYSGLIIFGLCLLYFYGIELLPAIFGVKIDQFLIKYSSIVLGSIGIYVIYQIDLTKNNISEISLKGKIIRIAKYFCTITTYFFINYILIKAYNYFNLKFSFYNVDTYRLLLIAAISLAYAYLLLRIKYIYDKVLKIINIVLNSISIVLFLLILSFLNIDYKFSSTLFVGLTLLIIINILIVFTMRDLVLRFIKKTNLSLEYYPLFIGIFLLLNITIYFISQLSFLANANIYMSFSYLVLAALSVIFGFRFKYIYLRIYGLILTFIALAKFFIIDLYYLSTLFKIISYFVFGILLIGISYIYQTVKNKIDKKNSKGENDEG